MARALTIVKHEVTDYDKWRLVYDEVQPLREKYGILDANVLQNPSDENDVTVLHWFASADKAQGFVGDPELKDAMGRAGVAGPPRIEIVVEA
jgi:hypothetical protein